MSTPDPTQQQPAPLPPAGQSIQTGIQTGAGEYVPAQDAGASGAQPVEETVTPVPADVAHPAEQPATSTAPRSSVAKVEEKIEEALSSLDSAVAVFARPLIGKLPIPSDPALLDEVLVEGAKLMLSLRSDHP
jgi:hypothetical protein